MKEKIVKSVTLLGNQDDMSKIISVDIYNNKTFEFTIGAKITDGKELTTKLNETSKIASQFGNEAMFNALMGVINKYLEANNHPTVKITL